jgi:putative transposase
MQQFRQMGCLQNFAAIRSSAHNHLNQERHLYNRQNFKLNRAVSLAK